MKTIKLAGKFSHLECILDDDWAQMFEDGGVTLFNRFGYASIFTGKRDKYKAEFVHQVVADVKTDGKKYVVDHKNQNILDNRVNNLRVVDKSTNALNSSKVKNNNTSGVTGVSYLTRDNTWRVYLSLGGKRIYERRTKSELDAKLIAKFHNEIKML